MKKLALIGSSGGNFYRLGGNAPEEMLRTLLRTMAVADFEWQDALFVAADRSFDQKTNDDARASLYILEEGHLKHIGQGTIQDINQRAAQYDVEIAERIDAGDIDGLVAISSDPQGINKHAVAAAARKAIPIVGTGGTSMAAIQQAGGNVITISGTTGTSVETRSLSFLYAFRRFWHIQKVSSRFRFAMPRTGTGVMTAALPAFIALTVAASLNQITWLRQSDFFQTAQHALPILLTVLVAQQVTRLNSLALAASILAGVFAAPYGLFAGILSGLICGNLVENVFRLCLVARFPLTAANIVTVCSSGLLPGLLLTTGLANLLLSIERAIPNFIQYIFAVQPLLIGGLLGLSMWLLIIRGGYHAIVLPLILIELAVSGYSMIGAFDMLCLVGIASGMNFAYFVFHHSPSAARGLVQTACFGTYVESVYPYFKNKLIFIITLADAAVIGAATAQLQLRGSAYIPAFFAPILSSSPLTYGCLLIAAFLLSALTTLFALFCQR
ncbi:MAG: hypothetical protein ABF608_03365 [Sporolactobacillus sp.]